MTLYEQWLTSAYNKQGQVNEQFWDNYVPREQKIYEDILLNKLTDVKGTVAELAEKYDVPTKYILGFVDGINETQEKMYDIKELNEDTEIDLKIDFEVLYKKMVEYKADHLYSLPQWKLIFSDEQLEKFTKEQRRSKTIVNKARKVGRNDPCPCGSGKKYKMCCGANI